MTHLPNYYTKRAMFIRRLIVLPTYLTSRLKAETRSLSWHDITMYAPDSIILTGKFWWRKVASMVKLFLFWLAVFYLLTPVIVWLRLKF